MGKNKKNKKGDTDVLPLLVKCCEEVQEAVKVSPPLKWKKKNEEELVKQLGESAHLLIPGDAVSSEVEVQLNALGLLSKKYVKAMKKREEITTADVEEESPQTSEGLEEQIESAETLKQLREIVKATPDFEDFKTGAFRANSTIPDFKSALLELLNPVIEEKSDKKDKKKKDKKKDKKSDDVEKKTPMAHLMDQFISEGGSFEELCKKCQDEGDERGLAQKYTKGSFISHIKFRNTQKPGWLKSFGMEISDDGIVPIKAKKDKKKKKK